MVRGCLVRAFIGPFLVACLLPAAMSGACSHRDGRTPVKERGHETDSPRLATESTERSTVAAAAEKEGDGGAHRGELSRWDIRETLKAGMESIKTCYELVPEDAETPEGVVTLRIIIGETGDVSSSEVRETTLHNAKVESCIVQKVSTLKFPPPKGGSVLIDYPFMVRPGE